MDTLQGIKAAYSRCRAPVMVFDVNRELAWSNGRLSDGDVEALLRKGQLSSIATAALLASADAQGCVFCPLPLTDNTSGFSLISSGGYYIAVLHDTQTTGYNNERFWLRGADRVENALRSAVDRIAIATEAAERIADSDDPDLAAALDGVRLNAYRILRASAETATFSRLLGGEPGRRTVCDIRELLRALCDGVRSVCRERVELRLSAPDEPVLAELNVPLAERSILALLGNSLTYTRDGNEIDVSLSSAGGTITITVTDRGAGIKPELLPYVREPYFSREPANDSAFAPSLGLGLSIASMFCSSHGGALAISSEFGEGTTAAISFREGNIGSDAARARIANYVTDRFSGIYIELCELCYLPR